MDATSTILRCLECGREYEMTKRIWACPFCHGLLDIYIEPVFPIDVIVRRPPGLWRYRETLPIVDDANIVSLGEPMTPLIGTDCAGLFLKLDFMLPTGSYKDRGASVLVSKIKELGINEVVVDSSGNAGAAIAAYSARAGIRCQIFVSTGTTPNKVRQITLYGAEVRKVEGPRADVSQAALEAAQVKYYASHYWNPYFFEGTKTVAFELWEQLDHRVPDNIVTPVGHGTMLLGLYKGFKYLLEAGITHSMPRLHGVQTIGCAPLVEIMRQGLEAIPSMQLRDSIAEGIMITEPLRWKSIREAVLQTNGTVTSVHDQATLNSLHSWARQGILMEPTSATATAGYRQLMAEDIIKTSETTVVIVTGAGIKTANYL